MAITFNRFTKIKAVKQILITASLTLATLTLHGCGSSSDDKGVGYIQFYNLSENSPSLYLTLENSDEEETSHSGVDYTKSTARFDYEKATYNMQISWRDEDEDLNSIYEQSLDVTADTVAFIVANNDVLSPEILTYNIPTEDPETDEEIFNTRFLNMSNLPTGIDIYLSKDDETFNEANLIGSYTYTELSPSINFDLDSYIFYVTSAGENEVLYQSEAISFAYTTQYFFVIRANIGAGSSPFTMDIITTSSGSQAYIDSESESQFRVYNAINEHELLSDYTGNIDLHLNGVDDSPEVTNLAHSEFSASYQMPFGDYSIDLLSPLNKKSLLKNHLLSLSPNSNKSIFFYLVEKEEDEDDDGEDEISVHLSSLVVNNSTTTSILDHNINIVNFVDDFSSVEFYFVRHNETIGTAANTLLSPYASSQALYLMNNTYSVYAIAKEDSGELILASTTLTLDEESGNLFLIMEENTASATGYTMIFDSQKTTVNTVSDND